MPDNIVYNQRRQHYMIGGINYPFEHLRYIEILKKN